MLPLCEGFSGLPVHFDTGSQVLEASTVREKCVFVAAEGVCEQDPSQGQGVSYMS